MLLRIQRPIDIWFEGIRQQAGLLDACPAQHEPPATHETAMQLTSLEAHIAVSGNIVLG